MAKDSMQQASLFAPTPLATKRLRASDDLPDPESRQEQFPIKKIRNDEKLEHRAESSITTRAQREGVRERYIESMQLMGNVDEVERLKKELEQAQKQCSTLEASLIAYQRENKMLTGMVQALQGLYSEAESNRKSVELSE